MRVVVHKPADEIIRELFGPIQEAARRPYIFGLNPRTLWCDLAELRLSSLVCEFKPVGINRNFNLLAISQRMHKIFDNEAQAEIFLYQEDKPAFRKQQQDLLKGENVERTSYTPKYKCRPTVQMIEDKLSTWYGMKKCEQNESVPAEFVQTSDFKLPMDIEEDQAPDSLSATDPSMSAESVDSEESMESRDTLESEETTDPEDVIEPENQMDSTLTRKRKLILAKQ